MIFQSRLADGWLWACSRVAGFNVNGFQTPFGPIIHTGIDLAARQGQALLAHELAHLFLGHLGRDRHLNIPERPSLDHQQKELEAESTAFIVCARNGVECQSQSYLASYVEQDTTTEQLDLYQIMRAAGQVETILGLLKALGHG